MIRAFLGFAAKAVKLSDVNVVRMLMLMCFCEKMQPGPTVKQDEKYERIDTQVTQRRRVFKLLIPIKAIIPYTQGITSPATAGLFVQ